MTDELAMREGVSQRIVDIEQMLHHPLANRRRFHLAEFEDKSRCDVTLFALGLMKNGFVRRCEANRAGVAPASDLATCEKTRTRQLP
jgi:hypothetical protein